MATTELKLKFDVPSTLDTMVFILARASQDIVLVNACTSMYGCQIYCSIHDLFISVAYCFKGGLTWIKTRIMHKKYNENLSSPFYGNELFSVEYEMSCRPCHVT